MVGLAATVALMAGLGQGVALAQLPSLGGSQGGPPLGVQRIGVLEVTTVVLDGNTLFDIASPVVFNRSEPGDLVPVEVRARQVETHLQQVVSQALQYRNLNGDPEMSEADIRALIQVRMEEINKLPVLLATVGNLPDPRGLLTVIDSDAQYHGLTKLELAEVWHTILEEALQNSLVGRLPGALQQRLRRTGLMILAGLLITLALAGIWQMLGWHKRSLEQRKAEQRLGLTPKLPSPLEDLRSSVWHYTISLDHRLQLVAFLRWLMFWGMAFVWIMALAGVLYQFPQTRRYAVGLFSTPALLLLTWFVTGLINRVANLTIDRIASAWEKNELGSAENIQQKAMRISTITRATKGFKTTVIYLLALLWVLQTLRLAPASLLAVGALAALALSFAAQNLVKDLVNGFLILLEDQYAIGDLVSTGQVTGIVENLNLRITQIRGEDGRLVTLPNSLISQVDNLSRTWSRATIRFDVAYDTPVDHALAVVRHTAQQMGQDPHWGHAILDPMEMLGVEALSHAGITLLLWMRTRPLKQFLVAREFRRRLRLALEQEGIAIGMPHQVLVGDASHATEDPLALGREAHD